jgi:hypothetical protein
MRVLPLSIVKGTLGAALCIAGCNWFSMGDGDCREATRCAEFDAMDWCRTTGECAFQKDTVGADAGASMFPASSEMQSFTIPMTPLWSQIRGLSVLKVEIDGIQPVEAGQFSLLFDGSPAACDETPCGASLASCDAGASWSLAFRCTVPESLQTIQFVSSPGQQSPVFYVHVLFTEAVCSHQLRVCAA